MTLSEEFVSFDDSAVPTPAYPTVFGQAITPTIAGAIVAVLGIAGAGYLLLSLVMPALGKYQELQATQTQKQSLVQQKSVNLKQKDTVAAELARAKQQKSEVLTLFANEQTLDSLMLDVNRLIESVNTKPNGRAKMTKFVPGNQTAEIIADGSLGSEVNGKLKRRSVKIEMQGTFEQTQSILRNIERLQPLLLIKDYDSKIDTTSANDKDNPVFGPPLITTSFEMQALLPVSPEEAAQVTEAAKEKKK